MAKKHVPNLIVEFVSDSGTRHYLSVVEYRRENYLVVIDNISSEEVGAYVLDFAQQERIDLKELMAIITRWFYGASYLYPLSFEFSRLGLSAVTNKIYKTFELAHVTRLIGYDFRYDFEAIPKVRRRRANLIPAGTEIHFKRTSLAYKESEAFRVTTPLQQPQVLAFSSALSKSQSSEESQHLVSSTKT